MMSEFVSLSRTGKSFGKGLFERWQKNLWLNGVTPALTWACPCPCSTGPGMQPLTLA